MRADKCEGEGYSGDEEMTLVHEGGMSVIGQPTARDSKSMTCWYWYCLWLVGSEMSREESRK